MTRKIALSARTQAIGLLLLVATLGGLLGVMGDRLIAQQSDTVAAPQPAPVSITPAPDPIDSAATPAPSPAVVPEPDAPRTPPARPNMPYGDRLFSLLDLSDAQRVQIDSIMRLQQARVRALTEQIQPQFRDIALATRQAVEDVLTPDQRAQMRRMNAQRQRVMMEHRPGPQPDDRLKREREDFMLRMHDERQQMTRERRALELREQRVRQMEQRMRQMETIMRRRGMLPDSLRSPARDTITVDTIR